MASVALPSAEVLKHMAEEHVLYEFHRVAEFAYFGNVVALAIEDGTPEEVVRDLQDWVQSSILESALVHLRNVSDFLTKARPTEERFQTDLVADQYFENGWSNRPNYIFGENREEHQAALTEIHRRVVHLSTHRYSVTTEGAFAWRNYMTNQFPVLMRTFRRFLDDLASSDPERARWFDRCEALLTNFRY